MVPCVSGWTTLAPTVWSVLTVSLTLRPPQPAWIWVTSTERVSAAQHSVTWKARYHIS